jgi:hypothetical protein
MFSEESRRCEVIASPESAGARARGRDRRRPLMTETTTSNGAEGTTGTTRVRERTTIEIASLVADAKGCEPWELEPLSQVTDPDAIEELLNGDREVAFEIAFDYEGGRVTVTSDGDVAYEVPA